MKEKEEIKMRYLTKKLSNKERDGIKKRFYKKLKKDMELQRDFEFERSEINEIFS